jgi:hypothetical protein
MKIIGIKSEEEIEEIRKKAQKIRRKVNIETGFIGMFLWDCIAACVIFMTDFEYFWKAPFSQKLVLIGLLILGNAMLFFMPCMSSRTMPPSVQYHDLTKNKKLINSELILNGPQFTLKLTLEDESGKICTECVSGLYGKQEDIDETTIDLSNGTVRFAFR